MNIISVRNGVYTENGNINSEVHFEGLDDFIPFTASPDDSEKHGRQLFADLKAGKYGLVTPFTVTPEMLTAAKQAKHAEINAWRDAQENGNILFTLNDHKWDCGKASQTRLAPVVAVAKSGALPPDFFWTDADNIDVPMTTDELTALEAAMQQNMVLQGFRIHERQRQMKEDVDKLTDYKAIQNYVVGWPKGS
ncbi:DUF4376 domain-containing protein [Salmonella enterica]|uniref:DUF4376 domain-containing protein n=1 Tax=Salmonella enterica subsp. salamae serovar 47:b:1,5 TaxID=1967619 RepID=A0A701UC80_SALER|nr:DUF4376 domain-containing protein [Salmonella enterica]HAC6515018.1 DUF4376 domain-containing protein [Salmonella enterica subsp. salamae serovar 47:b:1,5]HAE2324779.1 DUF4376 domain-containing protein [Salmonella enterica subsp. diarizonae serovar 65:(k):z]EAR7150480.1 DUF4376 domain-containing protein [Salmonella enterica]EJY4049038.1 DUF4376 domain-containing protein [Salmonella enterica]ELF8888313.1 DUF4376 domain-containing protein [Salmonella enterica]